MERESAIVLILLKTHMPTSFFDFQVHLLIHLVQEVKLVGLLENRYMHYKKTWFFKIRRINQKIPQMSPCSTWPTCHFGQVNLDPTILIRSFWWSFLLVFLTIFLIVNNILKEIMYDLILNNNYIIYNNYHIDLFTKFIN